MMYNNMQHAAQGPPPPNDFYGRTQTGKAGPTPKIQNKKSKKLISVY